MIETDKFIVLGHTGFIGQAVFNQLKETSIPVVGLSSKQVDLTRPKSVRDLLKTFTSKTTLIFSAAQTRTKGDSPEVKRLNELMTVHVAEALYAQPVSKCVYLSSTDVYGYPCNLPLTEDAPLQPKTYYASSKQIAEIILDRYCQIKKIPLLILRYNGIYGPGQKEIKYGPNAFIRSIVENNTIQLWGEGEELRDMVYVKDLAKIISQFSQNNAQGIYNIATGQSVSFLDVAFSLQSLIPSKPEIVHLPRSGPKFDQQFDISKLRDTLTDLNFTPLSQTLREMYHLEQEPLDLI